MNFGSGFYVYSHEFKKDIIAFCKNFAEEKFS